MIRDKILTCRDCGKDFVFGVGEQEFFNAKGLVNEPKRCPNCRVVSKIRRNGGAVEKLTEVNCAQCAEPAVVPFQPNGHRPILCARCFANSKDNDLTQTALA